jgi:hypothetical protein
MDDGRDANLAAFRIAIPSDRLVRFEEVTRGSGVGPKGIGFTRARPMPRIARHREIGDRRP